MGRVVFCTGDQGEKGSPGEKGRTGGFGFPGIHIFFKFSPINAFP